MLSNGNQSYIIKVLTGLHDVRSPLCLVELHPALTQELPAGQEMFSIIQCDHTPFSFHFIIIMSSYQFYVILIMWQSITILMLLTLCYDCCSGRERMSRSENNIC